MAEVAIPILHQPLVQLRTLIPEDVVRIKELCDQWFPIQYPDHWFEDITSSSRFFSLGAVIDGQLEGLIISEMKPHSRLNVEDQGIVSCGFGSEPMVAYILSLGVVVQRRRNGIGSMLLQQLMHYLQSDASGRQCSAVFLHVLSSNTDAIKFYKSQKFSEFRFLPFYYFISGQCVDGVSYVRYMNGGRAPASFSFLIRLACKSLSSCSMRLFRSALRCISQVMSWRISILPARLVHQLPRKFCKQSTAVKYHQVASA